MTASSSEDAIERARRQWTHRGTRRPPWADEPGPGQESVWDYPRPPALTREPRRVRVVHAGVVIARSHRAVRVLETASPPTFYIPPDDVRTDLLALGRGRSHCEWKGEATYWSLDHGGTQIESVGWSYQDPYPDFEPIRGFLGFYPSKVECYVEGERVRPQSGGFYGGWVTSDVVGPFKGDPGTGGW